MINTCKAKTKTGEPCRAAAGVSGLCYLHEDPNRAKSLGQRGGLGNRRPSAVDLPVPDNVGLNELRNLEIETIRRYAAGELTSQQASTLFKMYDSYFRVIPAVDLEPRIAALEAGLADQIRKVASQHSSMPPPTKETAASDNGNHAPEVDFDSSGSGSSDRQELMNQMNKATAEPHGGVKL